MFRIELSMEADPDYRLLSSILYCAVADGLRFNSDNFDGTYRIVPSNPSEEIVVTESGDVDRTELLADAIDEYTKFDSSSTGLGIMTTYVDSNPALPCFVQVHSRDDDHVISIGTNITDLQGAKHLKEFLELPKTVFQRFDFVYGASRYNEEEPIPTSIDAAYDDHPRLVTFYSSEMVNETGRETLLKAPAEMTVELVDGSVFLLASSELSKRRKRLQAVHEYLSNS